MQQRNPDFFTKAIVVWNLLPAAISWISLFIYVVPVWIEDPEYHFAFIVPFIVALLVLRENPLRTENAAVNPWPYSGWFLICSGILIVIAGEWIKPVDLFSRLPAWVISSGCTILTIGLIMRGWGVRYSLRSLPLLLLSLMAIPAPQGVIGSISQALQLSVTAVATEILNLFMVPARQMGNILITGGGSIGIDEACSGIRSLQATLTGGLFLGLFFLRKWRIRIFLLLASLAVVWINNVIRVTGLAFYVATCGSSNFSLWHELSGTALLAANIVLLMATTAGLAVFEERSGRLTEHIQDRDHPFNVTYQNYLRPSVSLFLSASILILGPLIREIFFLTGDQENNDGYLFEKTFPITGYTTYKGNIDKVRNQLRFDEATDVVFMKTGSPRIRIYNARWGARKLAYSEVSAHSPEACFQLSGWTRESNLEQHSLKLGNKLFPLHWQFFKYQDTLLYVGSLHLAAGEPRMISPGEEGWMGWRYIIWDLKHLVQGSQEVFLFAVEVEEMQESAKLRMILENFLNQRLLN